MPGLNRVQTIYKSGTIKTASLKNIPLLGTTVSVTHTLNKTEFANTGNKPVIWRAAFYNKHDNIIVNGKVQKSIAGIDESGKTFSYVDVKINAGKNAVASVK